MAFGEGGKDDMHWLILLFLWSSSCYSISTLIGLYIIKNDMLMTISIGVVITSALFYLMRNWIEFRDPERRKYDEKIRNN